MSDGFSYLEVDDIAWATDLLVDGFGNDLMYRYVYQTDGQRRRWLRKSFQALVRQTIGYGVGVTWSDAAESRSGLALWYLPDYPFPPPLPWLIYHSLPLLPMIFESRVINRRANIDLLQKAVFPAKRRYLHLMAITVDQASRGRGIGRRLVEWGQQHAARDGCGIFLCCWSDLLPFYEPLGFKPIAEAEFAEGDNTLYGLWWEPEGATEEEGDAHVS